MEATRVFSPDKTNRANIPGHAKKHSESSRSGSPRFTDGGSAGVRGQPSRMSKTMESGGTPLYVYDRVIPKQSMRRRLEQIPLTENRRNLTDAYRKKAHLRYDVNQNLYTFYHTPKGEAADGLYMGRVVDISASLPAKKQKQNAASAFSAGTQNTGRRSDRINDQSGTRMFNSYDVRNGTGGGAAVKEQPNWLPPFFQELYRKFLESIDEKWQRDVDIAKKQALLHKKWLEHKRALLLALMIFLLLIICSAAIYQLLFVVRHVEADGSQIYSYTEILTASGLDGELNLYDFHADEVADSITFHCPYIKSVDVTRTLPDRVALTLEDDQVRYCANIFGQVVALSPGLRVLGRLSEEEAASCILLRLPLVKEAVAGRTLVFTDTRNDRYIRQVLEDVAASSLEGRINFIDLRNESDIILYCDDMYLLKLGSPVDTVLKLRMADKVIMDPLTDSGSRARIDLSVTGEASVRAEISLDLTVEP